MEQYLKNYSPDFQPFFETRLMARIEKLSGLSSVDSIYSLFFRRFVYSGFAAIAAILIVIFIMNGNLGVDSLLGVEEMNIENAIAMAISGI